MSAKSSNRSMYTLTTANTSISSVATSHSPVLSLSPGSGFYSLVEESPSTGQSNPQSYLELPNPISSRNEISHMESKYSHSRRGSPLETISEEYEGVSTSEVRRNGSGLFEPCFFLNKRLISTKTQWHPNILAYY